ncbi:Cytochrome P450 CYP12A2 [Eumeta japonica]|uniref:Cytochrome P450 CYP12A2 n=1 Tax=Eumeta variegata TaxID=151549 RepID=A0A4C1ZN40_EUMVA|nr:Cytochrome P450 CYP12A2 [Eumeta japonica]
MAREQIKLRFFRSWKCSITNTFRICYARYSTADTKKILSEIPGLTSLPIIGPLHHFLPIIGTIGPTGNFHQMVGLMHKKFGPVVKFEVFSRSTMVMLFEPEHFDKVFRAEETNPSRPGFETLDYYRSELRKNKFNGVYGLTTAQGAKWRDFRTKVNPALLMPKLIKLYTPLISEVVQDMVKRIDKLKADSDYIHSHFNEEITKFSLEAVALVGLGSRLGCLEDNLPNDHPSRQLMQSSKDILNLAFKLEFLPHPWKYIPTLTFKKIIKVFDLQWSISEKYIEEAKKRINERGYNVPEEEKSIIERLLAVDQTVAIMMANEMLLAGIDTVAFSIISILYHLAKNPEKQQKLREELNSTESKRSYLKACIKEALRIWAVIPGNLRRTTKEHHVGGYIIPVGVDVVAPNQYLSNLDKHYVRAKEFIPERWIVDKTDPLYYGNTHPMVTSPFGFGIRSCIGRRLAELEIELFIAQFIQHFEVSWDGPPIKVVTTVSNNFSKPFNFRFKSLS